MFDTMKTLMPLAFLRCYRWMYDNYDLSDLESSQPSGQQPAIPLSSVSFRVLWDGYSDVFCLPNATLIPWPRSANLSNSQFSALDSWTKYLPRNMLLDGVLRLKGHQTGGLLVKRGRHLEMRWDSATFYVSDAPDQPALFEQRLDLLQQLLPTAPTIRAADTAVNNSCSRVCSSVYLVPFERCTGVSHLMCRLAMSTMTHVTTEINGKLHWDV
jgi:hypothetical protein